MGGLCGQIRAHALESFKFTSRTNIYFTSFTHSIPQPSLHQSLSFM